ncbi:MAG: hypothetical protein K6G64_00895 [Eubacterium sp.]|nr:hypothetical protein [Eubacterium sp.]
MAQRIKRTERMRFILQRRESKLIVNFIVIACTVIGVFLGIYNFMIYQRCDKVTATLSDIQVETQEYYDSKKHTWKTKEITHYYISYDYKGETYDPIQSPVAKQPGEKFEILVEPDHPSECYTKNELFITPLFIFISGIVIFIAYHVVIAFSDFGRELLPDDAYLYKNRRRRRYGVYEDFESDNYYDHYEHF